LQQKQELPPRWLIVAQGGGATATFFFVNVNKSG
jgi:hypothetical protein